MCQKALHVKKVFWHIQKIRVILAKSEAFESHFSDFQNNF